MSNGDNNTATTSRYAATSTAMLVSLLDMPNLLSKPAILTELAARGVERRVSVRRTDRTDGRRRTDTVSAPVQSAAVDCGCSWAGHTFVASV